MLNRAAQQRRLRQQFHGLLTCNAQALNISLPVGFSFNPTDRKKLEFDQVTCGELLRY